jgi:hypothetical protein
MATNAQIAGPTAPADIRRFRISLHLNSALRRRWLLVQMVSIPAGDPQDDNRWTGWEAAISPWSERPERRTLASLLDDHLMARTLGRSA